jgi:hypothetical protein
VNTLHLEPMKPFFVFALSFFLGSGLFLRIIFRGLLPKSPLRRDVLCPHPFPALLRIKKFRIYRNRISPPTKCWALLPPRVKVCTKNNNNDKLVYVGQLNHFTHVRATLVLHDRGIGSAYLPVDLGSRESRSCYCVSSSVVVECVLAIMCQAWFDENSLL